ncbi:uncharacterized protein LOC144715997 isoform X2 [Wolffia australiana]
MKPLFVTTIGIVIGLFVGSSFPSTRITTVFYPSGSPHFIEDKNNETSSQTAMNNTCVTDKSQEEKNSTSNTNQTSQICVPTNPRGAELLVPGIIMAESDLYLRRSCRNPTEFKPKYLVAFTVGHAQRLNIDACVKKFSSNFTILLFHYDGVTTEWNESEWSKQAIHISVPKQTKWWYAKRFLHPDIVAPYEYIFIWDEDLGLEHFDAEEYIKIVRKHGLEISQPGVEPNPHILWEMTRRRSDREIHRLTEEKRGQCQYPYLPPCGAFVEIQAPVFSTKAWRCVWHLIQNDLVHGWGLDFAMWMCLEHAVEKIGVVDAQWIVHQRLPSLTSQGKAVHFWAPQRGVMARCHYEMKLFQDRLKNAIKAYFKSMGITLANSAHP